MNKTLVQRVIQILFCKKKSIHHSMIDMENDNFSLDEDYIDRDFITNNQNKNQTSCTLKNKSNDYLNSVRKMKKVSFCEEPTVVNLKKYAMKKLDLTSEEVQMQELKNQQLENKNLEVEMVTEEELNEILSSMSDFQVVMEQVKLNDELKTTNNSNIEIHEEFNEKDEKIQKLERVMENLQKKISNQNLLNINTSISIDNNLNNINEISKINNNQSDQSLEKNKSNYYQDVISQDKFISIEDFEKTIISSNSDSSTDSEITYFINHYNPKAYSKNLAGKMELYLKRCNKI